MGPFVRIGGRPWQVFLTEDLSNPIGMQETYATRGEIFDLYESRSQERETKRLDTLQKKLENTQTSLPADAYAGAYRNTTFGEVRIETLENAFTVSTGLVDFEMSHWHLDTFLIEFAPWKMREFATFTIGPDGVVESLDLLDFTFEPVQEE